MVKCACLCKSCSKNSTGVCSIEKWTPGSLVSLQEDLIQILQDDPCTKVFMYQHLLASWVINFVLRELIFDPKMVAFMMFVASMLWVYYHFLTEVFGKTRRPKGGKPKPWLLFVCLSFVSEIFFFKQV